jgi:hypothetical protein
MCKAQIKDDFLDKLRTRKCESNIDHVIEEHATHQITCQLTPYTGFNVVKS